MPISNASRARSVVIDLDACQPVIIRGEHVEAERHIDKSGPGGDIGV